MKHHCQPIPHRQPIPHCLPFPIFKFCLFLLILTLSSIIFPSNVQFVVNAAHEGETIAVYNSIWQMTFKSYGNTYW